MITFHFTVPLITDAFMINGYVMGSLTVKIVMMNSQSSVIKNVKIVNSRVQMEHAFRNLRSVMVTRIAPMDKMKCCHYVVS